MRYVNIGMLTENVNTSKQIYVNRNVGKILHVGKLHFEKFGILENFGIFGKTLEFFGKLWEFWNLEFWNSGILLC